MSPLFHNHGREAYMANLKSLEITRNRYVTFTPQSNGDYKCNDYIIVTWSYGDMKSLDFTLKCQITYTSQINGDFVWNDCIVVK